MKPILLPFLVPCVLAPCALLLAADPGPRGLPRSSPEAQGISSAAVLEFIDTADRRIDSLHGFVLVRHGNVVATAWWSPYGAESPHELYSLSKSFTSTAVGIAAAEGRLSIDDTVLSHFPDAAPAGLTGNLSAMRIRDLLSMSTGHEKEPPTRPDQVSAKSFLAQPVPFKPGTHFLYNTAATFMLSAIVEKATGQKLLEYLKPRLFDPLGIDHPNWETNSEGIALGGYGLSVRTEDIARLGQLYLQKGKWQGKQLLTADWVEAATSRQTSNGSNPLSDWDQGYGYQFWRCRHGAYRGDGAFGQYCIVIPEKDAVVAITSGLGDMQTVLNLVWDTLLPAMGENALPEAPDTREKLEDRAAGLVLRTPVGKETSPTLAKIAGKKYVFPPNDRKLEAIAIERAEDRDGVLVLLRANGADQRLMCRQGRWTKSRISLGSGPERAVASSGAWTSDDTLEVKLCFYETPFTLTVKLRFEGDRVHREARMNVGFGPTEEAPLEGRSE